MQPARAKAELMLLKPQDVKGDKAHLRVKVREKVRFAVSPPLLARHSQEEPCSLCKEQERRNPCDAEALQGLSSDTFLLELTAGGFPAKAPASHLLFPDQSGNYEQVLEE